MIARGDDQRTHQIYSVTELNRAARELIERGMTLMWVAGEVSNFVRAASGHSYFSLKDGQAQVRCVMFRHKAQLHDWSPANGMQIEVRAVPSFYEARGEFQLMVEVMRRSGLGALYAAFERLKAKLLAEGLFDETAKLPLPPHPRAIGVITSPKAAALRDVLTTLRRRMPRMPIIFYPTQVQGEGAASQIAAAIAEADRRQECDVLILCRGGGSIEDLWAFNEEIVARAVYSCALPVVTGIGHESDFTIADFVADARAATPTAAAQLVCPDCVELRRLLQGLGRQLARGMQRTVERRMQLLDTLARTLIHPGERIANRVSEIHHLGRRLHGAWAAAMGGRRLQIGELARRVVVARPDVAGVRAREAALSRRLAGAAERRLTHWAAELKRLSAQLAQLHPHAVLQRGYGIIENADGVVIRDSSQLRLDEDVRLTFAHGSALAGIKSKTVPGS